MIKQGLLGEYPSLVNPEISRDFVYVDDACGAFVETALHLRPAQFGDSFNIGSGHKTTIRNVVEISKEIFNLKTEPVFNSLPDRDWDVQNWFANTSKTKQLLEWEARTAFKDGLKATTEWYIGLEDKEKYEKSSKKFELDTKQRFRHYRLL